METGSRGETLWEHFSGNQRKKNPKVWNHMESVNAERWKDSPSSLLQKAPQMWIFHLCWLHPGEKSPAKSSR